MTKQAEVITRQPFRYRLFQSRRTLATLVTSAASVASLILATEACAFEKASSEVIRTHVLFGTDGLATHPQERAEGVHQLDADVTLATESKSPPIVFPLSHPPKVVTGELIILSINICIVKEDTGRHIVLAIGDSTHIDSFLREGEKIETFVSSEGYVLSIKKAS